MISRYSMAGVTDALKTSRVWRSVFRHAWPETARTQSLAVMSNVFLHLHPTSVRRSALRVSYSFCLGGISFLFFLALTLSGVLLMFYYVPSVDQAYNNIKDLETSVNLGMLLRNVHRWAAHGMVITVLLHMARVFYTRAYKPPREFNWVVGVVLLVVTLLLSFTGYLLPWDQLAFWAITVGTNMGGAAPMAGKFVRFLMLGGYEVGQNALIRFYTLHVIGFPLLAAVLMALHFWRVRKDGFSGPL
ncbi:MAG: cytochrome b N-terminal domain-containing protein [Chloroflexi bacterium]|nr:cytochrome b N-terminal domain-containing protein [Chloroflexota bacterium]